MRSSDWSSDVCSSDLLPFRERGKASATSRSDASTPPRNFGGRALSGLPERRGGGKAGFSGRSHLMNRGRTAPWAYRNNKAGGLSAPASLERKEWRRHVQAPRSEEHTSELQSLMRISYAVFCLK